MQIRKMFVKQWARGDPVNPKMAKKTQDKNAIYPGDTKRQESCSTLATSAESSSDFSLSPTSVASSDFSASRERNSRSPAFSTGAPVLEQRSERDVAATKYGYEEANPDTSAAEKYGYDDASPDDKEDYGYGDSSPDDKTKYGYGDASPRDLSRKTRLSSSMKESGRPRRASIQIGGYGDASPRGLSRKTSLTSSMKQSGRPRRASIQCGGEIEVYLIGQDKPVKRRTSITFNEQVAVKDIATAAELTDEPEALWFQDDEYDRMKQKAFELVDKVEHGTTGGKNYCVRGLEKLMPSKAGRVMENKYGAWDSVLDEQDIQRDSGTFDEEYMANVYKFSNLSSKQEAAERGRQDEAEIKNYLRTTRRLCRRSSM
jgi:hypothetical protein